MSKAAELAALIANVNKGSSLAAKNFVINGAMNVAQRGTSTTGVGSADGLYPACDRWRITSQTLTAGRATVSQVTDVHDGFTNALKLECTTADTSIAAGELFGLNMRFEGQNLQSISKGSSDAKPLTVSFYVKGNASATYACEIADRDNSRHCSKSFSVTTSWNRIELNFPADTTGAFDNDNAASMDLNFFLHAGTNFTSGTQNTSAFASTTSANRALATTSFFDSTDRTLFITGVQMEIGEKATEFEHEPFETTLRKCQRYYLKRLAGSAYSYWAAGHNATHAAARLSQNFPVEMNHIPVLETSAASTFYVYSVDTVALSDVPTINNPSVWGSAVTFPTASSGLTAGRGANAIANNSAGTAFLAFESEL